MARDETAQPKLGNYLDMLSQAIFQSGMSWKMIERKWPGTHAAFHGFDIDWVANMSPDELDALAQDTRIIRNRRKVEAIVVNANRMLELEKEHGSFENYLASHADFEATLASVKKNFKYMGDIGTYFFLHVVGRDVPPHEEFCGRTG